MPGFSSPDEFGPWRAGTQQEEVSGSTGVQLPTQIWFPTEETSGAIATYDGLELGNSLLNADPACDVVRPVVVFSHGNGGLRFQSVFLMERLASHGYVVVAPDHVGNTTFDLDSIPRTDVALRRPIDVADAFDFVASALPDCVDPTAGFAIVGHSFGGWTTLATSGANIDLPGLTAYCESSYDFLCGLSSDPDLSDDRVWAAVPLAPVGAISFGAGLANVQVPILIIAGIQDYTTPWETEAKPIFAHLDTTPAHLAGLDRVGHYSFAVPCIDASDGCGDDFLDPEEAQDQIATLATAFLNEQLGADSWLPPDWAGLVWESAE